MSSFFIQYLLNTLREESQCWHPPPPISPLPCAPATLLPLLPLSFDHTHTHTQSEHRRQTAAAAFSCLLSRTPWSVFGLCLSAVWWTRLRPDRGSGRESRKRRRKRRNMTTRAQQDAGIQPSRIRWRITRIEWGRRRVRRRREETRGRTPGLGS